MPVDPSFALIGDCNAARIGRIARARGLRFLGGPIGNGRGLEKEFFDLDGTTFVPRQDVPPQAGFGELFRCGLPILSTVGSNIHRLAQDLHQTFYKHHKVDHAALSDAVLRQVVVENRTGPLGFYRAAVEHGCRVHAVHSTQRFPDTYAALALRIEPIYLDLVAALGVPIVDVRAETTDAEGQLLPGYCGTRADDKTHANDAWSTLVLDRFLEAAGLGALVPA